MKEKDKNRIIQRYNERLSKYGNTINTLASGTEDRRNLRFKILTEIGIRSGNDVLDLGCGFGNLYQYLKDNKLDVDYTGVDINPSLIEVAQKQYPDAKFKVYDLLNDKPMGKYDYIVSTSCFNLKLSEQDNYSFVAELLSKCYSLANQGVAIDFLTSYVDFKGNPEEAFYYSPEKIFSIAKSISNRVCLRHDYPLFEFCLYLYPAFKGWQKK